MATLQNELLKEILVESYGEEIELLQEYLFDDIDTKIKYLQNEILFHSGISDDEIRNKTISSLADTLRKVNSLKDKIENDILNVAFNELRHLCLIDRKCRANSFKEYLFHKGSLKENSVKNDNGKNIKVHTGEKVLNKSEVDKILNQAFKLSKEGLTGIDIFAKSQNNVENFAKGITDILDLYSEFAKLGNKKTSKKDDDSPDDLF